ncbi:hypothetical protein [Rhizobium sp. 1399]|jgi:hypothetical protein|uniref:hypothetical protein n=1 Tax=Rhizobium sp. 1399 TaxID=2817758 RepID=UPI0028675114|nr:hypothetical protein [Rhizobium sp. 1399]MDR6664266.1 hypothetical protein [Rhizobium sp. 1399]
MTAISSANHAALLILQQTNASLLPNKQQAGKSAADSIAAIANGVSSQTSAVKTQASSTINSALLDVKESNDGIVSSALDFLDSDDFKTSDAGVTDVIKKLINDDGDKFASLVKAEKAKNPSISDDNAMANAIQRLIRDNRSKFGDGEFVIGFKLGNGGKIISNIEDKNGNSTSNTLMAGLQAAHSAVIEAAEVINSSDGTDTDALKAASAALNNSNFGKATNDLGAWIDKWRGAFGF